jgi:hypothetical protein
VINAHKHQHALFLHQIGQIHEQMDDQDRLVGRLVNDTGLQTRAGKRHGYARVRVRVHKAVPVYPYG